jgi:phosphatidylinositol alpha-1,6-mannosyltransferase
MENVFSYSLLGPDDASFEAPFDVTWHGDAQLSRGGKASFSARVLAACLSKSPDIVHAAHINLSALAHIAARTVRATSVLNVYGLEVWSSPRVDARWGLRHCDHVVSDCHFTAHYIGAKGLRRDTMSVIWDCVDTSRFSPGAPNRDVLAKCGVPDPATGVNLLTLGRLTRDAAHKGYGRLLQVFAKLAGDCPELRLIYGGRGSLADDLRAEARALGLSERVFFLGMIDDGDLPDIYRSAHIFSLVSDRGMGRGEGIPLTPLEAAACGVPILVGNQDGSQEATVDGETGFILDPFDLDAHAAAIRRLCADESLRRALAESSVARTRAYFRYERFVENHRSLAGDLLRKRI